MTELDPRADTRRLEALREQVRELTGSWLAAGRYTPRSDCWLRSFDLEFSRELAARGLIGITWPVEFGGGGLDARSRTFRIRRRGSSSRRSCATGRFTHISIRVCMLGTIDPPKDAHCGCAKHA